MRIKEFTESIYVEVLLYLDRTTLYTTTEYVDFDKTRVLHNISLLKYNSYITGAVFMSKNQSQ